MAFPLFELRGWANALAFRRVRLTQQTFTALLRTCIRFVLKNGSLFPSRKFFQKNGIIFFGSY